MESSVIEAKKTLNVFHNQLFKYAYTKCNSSFSDGLVSWIREFDKHIEGTWQHYKKKHGVKNVLDLDKSLYKEICAGFGMIAKVKIESLLFDVKKSGLSDNDRKCYLLFVSCLYNDYGFLTGDFKERINIISDFLDEEE